MKETLKYWLRSVVMCVQLLLLYKSIYKNFQNHAKVRLWIIPLKLAKSARGANESLSEKAQKIVAFVAFVNARIPDPSASKSPKLETSKSPLNVPTILVPNPSVPPSKTSQLVWGVFVYKIVNQMRWPKPDSYIHFLMLTIQGYIGRLAKSMLKWTKSMTTVYNLNFMSTHQLLPHWHLW